MTETLQISAKRRKTMATTVYKYPTNHWESGNAGQFAVLSTNE